MYILDEVDAALDLSHTQNIGRLLKTRFKGAQFIVVSLKDGMFQNANKYVYPFPFVKRKKKGRWRRAKRKDCKAKKKQKTEKIKNTKQMNLEKKRGKETRTGEARKRMDRYVQQERS